MRITGGALRGRPLRVPEGQAIRPTSERARQAVFNILAHAAFGAAIADAVVVDVFSGVGAMGLEALSRGARHATFIDQDAAAIACVRANAAHLRLSRQATLLKLDATRLPPPPLVAEAPAAIAFLDPPYRSGLAVPTLSELLRAGWIGRDAICTVEVEAREPFVPPPRFALVDERTYGRARVLFLKAGA